jgi:alpha-glucosidase
MTDALRESDAWWREGVLYQVYPRSYQDSDGDGAGDLRGIAARLDHLEWLGVDGIWLSPTFPSPNADWGYDVADYYGVHPDFGTMEDLDRLIEDAGRRGIRVLLDLVPNHTSDQHEWFRDAASSRDSAHRDWYVWADGDGPPNNWRAAFGGQAWTFHEPTGQWYLHNFLPGQPDLNWWNPEVREAFDDILRFWFDREIAGFRIDVAHSMVKDRELRDDPPAGPDDHPHEQARGLRQVYSMNRPEGHEVLQRWRALADARPEPHPVLVGETFVYDLEQLIPFYGAGDDELHLAFNIPFALSEFDPARLREVVETMEARLPEAAWPVWMGSNHDIGRMATRWAAGDETVTRLALLIILTLRGTPFLYAGDEIALPDGVVPEDRVLDVHDRDGCRTPIPWEHGPNAGFTSHGVEPWLPMTDPGERNVAAQRRDPGSTLNFVRDLIALRRAEPDLRAGAYATLPAPERGWAWRRGGGFAVALNAGNGPARFEGLAGRVEIATDRAQDGQEAGDVLTLAPASGVVVRLRERG